MVAKLGSHRRTQEWCDRRDRDFGQPCNFGFRFHVDGEFQNGGRVKKGRTAVFSSGVGSLEEIFTAMGPDHNDTPDENHAGLGQN